MAEKMIQTAGSAALGAFYAGWPKGWDVFNLAKDVWKSTGD